jgi:hypothetical protein
VRTALDRFEKLGFLTNTSTKTGRLITVLNWEKYQGQGFVSDKGSAKEPTKSRQRGDKDLTTNKNDKECYKKDKEDNMPAALPSEETSDEEWYKSLGVGRIYSEDEECDW